MNIVEELEWRGLIKDVSDIEKLKAFSQQKGSIYIGFDPSAPSLHLGNYLTLMVLKRIANFGHDAYALVGSITGLIGDPRDPKLSTSAVLERNVTDKKEIERNVASLTKEIKKLAGVKKVFSNIDFYKDMKVWDFLRDIGKMINVNYLLEKDVIARRLETGISYAEFSYTLLQGYDFLHLFETENIVCQAGGSDQWGNITTGLEMIRKNHGHNSSACCFSIPLLLKPDGTKFGKSESGAIYLDAEVTSPYEMYQFCLNVEDSMIEELLKKLTFLNQDEITSVMTNHSAEPFRRHGQKALGKEIICDIHGEKTYHEVVKMSEALFSGKLENLSNNELYNALLGTKKVFKADKNEYEVCELLVLSGMVGSKTEGRKLIEQKALSINGQQINDVNAICSIKHAYKENSFSYIKKGKKDYLLIKWN